MNDYEEDLVHFLAEKETGRIFGWNMSLRVDRSIHSRKWDHNEDSTFL